MSFSGVFTPPSRFSKILAAIVLSVIAIFGTRFLLLSQIPTSLAHDEMIYAINAKSVAVSGTDLTGTWNPLSLTPMHPMFAELPTLLLAPFFRLPIDPVVAARLPFVLMSLAIPVLLAGIVYELFKNRRAAVCTAILAFFNPWIWQFGRMSFDSYWSLFFFSLASYCLLRLRRWWKLAAMLPLFLGFYEYQGHKLAFVPWVAVFAAFLISQGIAFARKKKGYLVLVNWRTVLPPLTVFLFAVGLFCFYVFVQLPQQESVSRVGTFLLPSNQEIIETVNENRQLSLSTPFTSIVVNKYVVWGQELIRRYIDIFNPKHLFFRSQYAAYNVWTHGLFYVLDAGLILFGILALWSRKKFLVLGLFGVGLLTTVVSAVIGGGDSFIFRASLALPFLLMLAGVGAAFLSKILPRLLSLALVFAYGVGILYFAFVYYVRYPVYAAESHYFSDKILAEYVRRADPGHPILVYTDEPAFTYTAILFYNNLLNEENVWSIQQSYREETYVLDNIRLTTECVPVNVGSSPDTTVFVRSSAVTCKPGEDPSVQSAEEEEHVPSTPSSTIRIAAVKDSGIVYTIYHDTTCQNMQLPGFLYISRLQSFHVQQLGTTEFCQTWLMAR